MPDQQTDFFLHRHFIEVYYTILAIYYCYLSFCLYGYRNKGLD